MRNPKDTIGNRNRDVPACSEVPQPTAPPRAPVLRYTKMKTNEESSAKCHKCILPPSTFLPHMPSVNRKPCAITILYLCSFSSFQPLSVAFFFFFFFQIFFSFSHSCGRLFFKN